VLSASPNESHRFQVALLEATIAQRQGRLEQALSLAGQVLSASPDESHRFQVALLKGTVACAQDDPARARTALVEVDKHHVANAPLLAARERLAGNIFLLERNPAEAAAAFDRAAALFQEAKHYRDMALTLCRAGEAYQEAGDTQRAEDRRFRAKRSLAAQGEKAG
jgi:tetratricopeptide (TPR) repeat protein